MWSQYFVRVGIFGQVGRLSSLGGAAYPRGKRVICRTNRGLEVGEVLSEIQDSPATEYDGTILRPVTVEDDLLLARLEKKKDEAYAACVQKLEEHGITAILMDVEHLFDGRSLYFYFLGEVTPELSALTEELAATYDAAVQFQKFAETLSTGCGPDCGTEAATGQGCGSGGCSTCAVASACGTGHKH